MLPETTLFDPVLGLDFHLVQPPGGPPVLVPHPTVGVLFDPFELIPELGAARVAGAGAHVSAGTLALPNAPRYKALSSRAQRFADKLCSRLKLGSVARNRIHRGACTVTGHGIDVATGKLFAASTDISLPGPFPLELERVWYSTSTYDGPFGHGWHHGYDAALLVTPALSILRTPDGRAVAFPPLEPGEAYLDRAEGLTLSRFDVSGPGEANANRSDPQAPYRLETPAGFVYRFGPLPARDNGDAPTSGEAERHVLVDVESRNGQRIALSYDDAGRLRAIHDSAGRVLRLVLDEQGRIAALEAPHPEFPGHTLRAATYAYDERGNLTAVTDALGYVFYYAYAGPLLMKQTDRAGRELYFQWDGDDHTARCVRTWSAAGTYGQELTYEPNVTRVADSLGHTTLYEHDGARVLRTGG
jgi:YD repeat-containing protein